MTLPDVAYLVHEADNEPLRYSLRSLAQYATGTYRKVWIVGSLPEWATGMGHIPAGEPEPREKFASIRAKLEALCADRRVAARVVVMNDDFFATGTVKSWEPTHLGSTAAYVAARGRPRNTWWEALRLTAEWMADRGHGDILCYAGHVPLMYDRVRLRALLAEYPADRRLLDAGLYPEAGAGGIGTLGPNAKVGGPSCDDFADKVPDPDSPPLWLSSNDASFEGMLGGYIRGMLREPGPYER